MNIEAGRTNVNLNESIFNDLTTIGISSLILLFVVVPIFALEQELKIINALKEKIKSSDDLYKLYLKGNR